MDSSPDDYRCLAAEEETVKLPPVKDDTKNCYSWLHPYAVNLATLSTAGVGYVKGFVSSDAAFVVIPLASRILTFLLLPCLCGKGNRDADHLRCVTTACLLLFFFI